MKILKRLSLLSIILIIALVSYIYVTLKLSEPKMSGEILSDQLAAKVEIIRDKEGIPHIFAKKRHDMYFALGFVMASDRLFQYEIIRRAGAGRLSEIFGKKTLMIDKLFRTIGAKHIYEKKLGLLPPQIKEDFQSFTSGLNFYLKKYPLPIEFKILGHTPEEFTIMDAYYVAAYMAHSFTPMLKEETLYTRVANAVKDRDVSDLTVMKESFIKTTVTYLRNKLIDVDKVLSFLSPIEGSNAWVVSGDKSKSGYPILASDPHVTFSLPNLWYEAHITNEEDQYEMYGHFLPLIPYAAMGHNRDYGWGLTMSYVDDLDIFKSTKEVLFSKEELIKVRGGEDEKINVEWEVAGPRLNHILTDKEDYTMSWAFQLLDNRPILSFYNVAHAQSMQQVKDSLVDIKSPGVNVLYADKDKNYAHFLAGAFLKREKYAFSSYLNSPHFHILGEYHHDDKPHRVNEGPYLISTNDRPLNSAIDMRGSWYPKNRHDTVASLLKRESQWSLEKMKAVQTSNLDIFSKEYMQIITKVLENSMLNDYEKRVLNQFKKWNSISNKESFGALVYHQFNYHFFEVALEELDEADLNEYVLTTASWSFHRRMMLDLNNKWWDDKNSKAVENGREMIVAIFKKTVASLRSALSDDLSKWKWGAVHTLTYPHTLGMNKFLAPFFNLGPYPVDGAINVINHFRRKGYTRGHEVQSGPSTRRLVDFSNPEKSYGILPLGNSSHPLSPFYQNQRKRFLKGEYRLQLLNRVDIERDLAFKLILRKK